LIGELTFKIAEHNIICQELIPDEYEWKEGVTPENFLTDGSSEIDVADCQEPYLPTGMGSDRCYHARFLDWQKSS
jgi:hypothetical protein